MYNNFDYLKFVEKIKSALYDIYESQEVMIGEEQDENSRNKRVEKYIETKDLAVKLIENIESLYLDKGVPKEKNNVEESEPKIVQVAKQDELLQASNQIENVGDENEETIETEDVREATSKNDISDENIDKSNLPRFYLDYRNGDKPNFAFVPESIYTKLKANGTLEPKNNIVYKQDSGEKRGIIVRADQFMKLSLSKDRQEGVLKEAKYFRIEQAKKSRQKLQEEALSV